MYRAFPIVNAGLWLTACAGVQVTDYAGARPGPVLVIERREAGDSHE